MIRCWLGIHAWARTRRVVGTIPGEGPRVTVLVCTRCRAVVLPSSS